MKNTGLLFLVLFSISSMYAQYNSENLKADYTNSAANTYGNLRLYAIKANDIFLAQHKNIGNYTVLSDAVEAKKVMVTEVSSSGSVNTLFAENVSKDTVYVMAGEIVKGGKQDRIIAQDFLLTPGQKVDVGAFCVEHGRWTPQADGAIIDNVQIQNAGLSAPVFDETSEVVSTKVRKAAVVEKNQSAVWDEVEVVTSANGAGSSTGTYNALENAGGYQDTLNIYLQKFTASMQDSSIIGVVAVTGNRVIGCDLFATHYLFEKQYTKLLHSYITEAITHGEAVTAGEKDVQKYLDEFLSDESKQNEVLSKSGAKFNSNGFTLHCVKF